MICYEYSEPTYLVFASDLPGLLYYSHLPAAILSLLVGAFVFFHNPRSLLNRLLFIISICFSLWVFIDLITWTNIHSEYILFGWSFFGLLHSLISILSVYLIYVFLEKKDVTLRVKSIFLTLLLPVLVLSHTDLHLSGFDLGWCDAFLYEGPIYNAYVALLGLSSMLWIFVLLWKGFRKADVQFRKQILLMGFGVEFFLFSFFSVIYLVSFFINSGVLTEADTTLEFYGLFGMTVFMVMMSVLIVRFKTFNVGANAPIALVIGLLILTASQFTYVESRTGSTITAITLVLTGLIGIMLMRSVRKEIAQRKEIETLATDLAKANVRLKALDKQKSEFVSIASHQLRSPLTAIRGYASLLLDGSYGKFPKKASEPLERIEQSSRLMAIAIEDYLNVSRIESGNMKYDLSDFNLRDETEHVCDDLRQDALKRGLILLFRTDLKSRGVVHADLGKTVQIIQNLIHNSIKYTEKGTVKVLVRDDIVRKRIYIDIIDTGIGMSSETQQTIFQKFERAKNANSVNIHGTGLGLFVALKMAQAMQGNITATSEGEGKGSCFTIEFPLAM